MLEISNSLEEIMTLKINCNIYLFGSYLYSYIWADLDILILYKSYEDVLKIKQVFSRHLPHIPLDLNFMTQEEEKYFNFISKVNAKEIYSLLE